MNTFETHQKTLYLKNWKKTVKVPMHMIWVKHQIFILHNAWTPGQKMRLGGGDVILLMLYWIWSSVLRCPTVNYIVCCFSVVACCTIILYMTYKENMLSFYHLEFSCSSKEPLSELGMILFITLTYTWKWKIHVK